MLYVGSQRSFRTTPWYFAEAGFRQGASKAAAPIGMATADHMVCTRLFNYSDVIRNSIMPCEKFLVQLLNLQHIFVLFSAGGLVLSDTYLGTTRPFPIVY